VLLSKRQTDGNNKNGYVYVNHIGCTDFQAPAAIEPSVVALMIEN
jgi:ligand-binding sensor protein